MEKDELMFSELMFSLIDEILKRVNDEQLMEIISSEPQLLSDVEVAYEVKDDLGVKIKEDGFKDRLLSLIKRNLTDFVDGLREEHFDA